MSNAASTLDHAYVKLEELDYYALLLNEVCLERISRLRNTAPPPKNGGWGLPAPIPLEGEISFLFSAYLSASYSVVAYLKEEPLFKETAAQFQRGKPDFYGHGPAGGLRTRSVHFRPIKPGFEGFLQGPPNQTLDDFLDFLEEEGGGIKVERTSEDWRPSYFYLDESEPQRPIHELVFAHYFELATLLRSCGDILKAAET